VQILELRVSIDVLVKLL